MTEMGKVVPWGIDRRLGGLPEATADAINIEERVAVTTRRLHYCPRSTGQAAAAGAANLPRLRRRCRPMSAEPENPTGAAAKPATGPAGKSTSSRTARVGHLAKPATRRRARNFRRRHPLGDVCPRRAGRARAAQSALSIRLSLHGIRRRLSRRVLDDISQRRRSQPTRYLRSACGGTSCRSVGMTERRPHCATSVTTANIWRQAGCGNGCRWPLHRSMAWR